MDLLSYVGYCSVLKLQQTVGGNGGKMHFYFTVSKIFVCKILTIRYSNIKLQNFSIVPILMLVLSPSYLPPFLMIEKKKNKKKKTGLA